MRVVPWLLVLCLGLLSAAPRLAAQQNPDGRLPLGQLSDPTVLLLRDSAAFEELKVTDQQRAELRELADRLDPIFWPTRNFDRERAASSWNEATAMARREATGILSSAQLQRLNQIVMWVQGTRALLRDDVAEKLQLDEERRKGIREILDETATKAAELYQEASAEGMSAKQLEGKQRQLLLSEQRQILRKMTKAQRDGWVELAGEPCDVSRLGRVDFRAPALIAGETDWINGPRPKEHGGGQVRVVHFFAHGCINCIRNYEHYVNWDRTFRDEGLEIIGIHTPETSREREREALEKRVSEAGFQFPILIDNDAKNWTAWGTTMWPSVYLIDHQGRIRSWWYGELNWQGSGGEEALRRRIQELLAEARQSPEASGRRDIR
jgi:peroxiredoxin